jgi:ornithine--oxo-acid transaminase
MKRDYIQDVRGRGLFIGVEFKPDCIYEAYEYCQILKEFGLLAKPTHHYTIRFSPPLTINA